MFIGTIHQFCFDLIRRYGELIGLPRGLQVFESRADLLAILDEAMRGRPGSADADGTGHPVSELYDRISTAKRTLGPPPQGYEEVCREYEDMLLSMNAIDFDDIILYATRVLQEQPGVLRMYRTYYGGVCIDEAQDLNPAQYAFIRALAGDSMRVMMVGDPRQAIYGFSGATSDIMCKHLVNDYPDTVRFDLSDNFRSSKAILRAARCIEPGFEPEPHVVLSGEFSMESFADEREQAVWVVDRAMDLLAHGHPDMGVPPVPEDICIIARDRYRFAEVRGELEGRGVPYTLKSSVNDRSYETEFFEALWLGVRVLANPSDSHHLRLLNAMMGRPEDSPLPSGEGGDPRTDALRRIWDAMREQERTGGFDPREYEPIIDGYGSTLSAEESETFDEDHAQWTASVARYLGSSRTGSRSLSGLVTAASVGRTGKVADRGIVLSTVHLTKGLEYEAVFVITVDDGVFPSYRARTERDRAEERHSMFVAITRAKRVCHVCLTRTTEGRRGPILRGRSEYIEDLSAEFDVTEHRSPHVRTFGHTSPASPRL